MFKRIVFLSAAAVCLAAAILLIFNFTKEPPAPRAGCFIAAETQTQPSAPTAAYARTPFNPHRPNARPL